MNNLYKFCGKLSLLFYIFTLYRLWHLCKYGGLRSHLPALLLGGALCAVFGILWLISRKHRRTSDSENNPKKVLRTEVIVFAAATLLLGGGIVYSAIPYHGALSWKVDEWMREKKVALTHDNILEDGVEGILKDLDEALGLPEELYIANEFRVSFDENGKIQNIYTFLYGKDEKGERKTWLVDYDADKSERMTVWENGNANGNYEDDMRLEPMCEILAHTKWKMQIEDWTKTLGEGHLYEFLYMGKRSFTSEEGLQYVAIEGSGQSGSDPVALLRNGGRLTGFEVSLHIPELDSITPIRYITDTEYTDSEALKEENTMQQAEDAREAEKWTLDSSNGSMYFFLDDNRGWRLTVTDAAAGSRFYAMEKTVNGGEDWECVNEDPFAGQLGVAEGILFYDENFGIVGLAGASESWSRLYITRDGGATFEEIRLPMDTVTGLQGSVDDYDYLQMPEKEGDLLTITVTTEGGEREGIVFQSADNGVTWQYRQP